MEAQAYLFDLHATHSEWTKDLDFYEDELGILKVRLSEVSIKNTSEVVKGEVEKFQNQFIIQKEEIDRLKHEITIEEDLVEKSVKENPVAADHRKIDHDSSLEGRMEVFQTLFKEMKSEFAEFVGKYL